MLEATDADDVEGGSLLLVAPAIAVGKVIGKLM
jgi:hypothetical protein